MATLRLQGIGIQEGKLANDIKVGDTLLWNFGYTSQVVAILSKTKCYITIQTRSDETGKLYERRIKSSRIIGIKN